MLSAKIWLHFLRFSLSCAWRRRLPFGIADAEFLAREVFSGNFLDKKKKERLSPNLFLTGKTGVNGVSVSRIPLLPKQLARQLAERHLEQRRNTTPNTKFYGLAVLSVRDVRNILIDGKSAITPKCALTPENPFHAELRLLQDNGKDYDYDVVDELLSITKYDPQDWSCANLVPW